mmetsp:Transcript_79611/g.165362  ORF Transcript_79611/g.165362 Transcript_79611/m.165362 type:complete len:204 (+) Transcript_79611:942-1553(+)
MRPSCRNRSSSACSILRFTDDISHSLSLSAFLAAVNFASAPSMSGKISLLLFVSASKWGGKEASVFAFSAPAFAATNFSHIARRCRARLLASRPSPRTRTRRSSERAFKRSSSKASTLTSTSSGNPAVPMLVVSLDHSAACSSARNASWRSSAKRCNPPLALAHPATGFPVGWEDDSSCSKLILGPGRKKWLPQVDRGKRKHD